MMKHISVTDTTIRQAGKAAGYTLSFREKIELAKLLDRLGVSVIELHAVENPKIASLLIKSVASAVKESAVCVPVGLTKYREKLPKLTPYDAKGAKEVILIVDSFREKMKKERGIAVAYAADEFFIKAGLPLPEYEYYDEFTQLEDGVGLCTLLKHEFYEALDYFPPAEYRRTVTIPTGKAAYSTIKELANAAESRYNGLKIDVIAMENNFFVDAS